MVDREWLTDPEFSVWISALPYDNIVYCKLCEKEISVCGKQSLRAHAKGIKHTKLFLERYGGRKTLSKPKKPAVKKAKASVATGINFAFINVPSGSGGIPAVHQVIGTDYGERPKAEPSTSQRSVVDADTKEFMKKVDQMLSQHSSLLKRDASDFLKAYKHYLTYGTFRSSSNFDRYSYVKGILDDYTSQHDSLRKKIKTRLSSAF